MSLSRNQLIDWLRTIDVTGKTVLDVGAGPRDKWAINWVKGEPKSYITVDIELFPGIYSLFDLDSENSVDNAYDEAEYVFCLETLEHVSNPVLAAKHLSEMAEERLFVSVPFINPHHDKWDYLRFTGEWFEKVLKDVGFKEVIVKERVATAGLEDLKNFYRKEGLRVSKIRPEYGRYTYPIGYLVEARK